MTSMPFRRVRKLQKQWLMFPQMMKHILAEDNLGLVAATVLQTGQTFSKIIQDLELNNLLGQKPTTKKKNRCCKIGGGERRLKVMQS